MSQISIKRQIRKNIGPKIQKIGFNTGIMGLHSSLKKDKGAVVLMYHSVADESASGWIDPSNHVPAAIFDQQMSFLSKYRNVISLSELCDIVNNNTEIPEYTTIITFDDGYLDNLTNAAPILEKHGLPATLFLATGYIDRGENQWIDQVYSIFKNRSIDNISLLDFMKDSVDINDSDSFNNFYKTVCGMLISANPVKRIEVLDNLKDVFRPLSEPPRLTLTWGDVRRLVSEFSCFSLGSHTIEHTDLTSVSIEFAAEELIQSREIIKMNTGIDVLHFSFCYGRTSEDLRRVVESVGFKAACGGDGIDPVIHKDADAFRLPRIVGPSTMNYFDMKTHYKNSGLWRKLGRN